MSNVVRALRGATTVERDDPAHIEERTRELLEELFRRNEVDRDALISMQFSATADIVSGVPAVAARAMGLVDLPLICLQEQAVAGSLPLCLRVMVYLNTSMTRADAQHVYLHDAVTLRPDLTS